MKAKDVKTIKIIPCAENMGGVVIAPPSKSMAHRLLIASAFSGQKIIIKNMSRSNDVDVTVRALI